MPDQPTICSVPDLYADENVWLSQRMMAQLYDLEVPTINCHLKEVFSDELKEGAVIRNLRITAADSPPPPGAVRGGP